MEIWRLWGSNQGSLGDSDGVGVGSIPGWRNSSGAKSWGGGEQGPLKRTLFKATRPPTPALGQWHPMSRRGCDPAGLGLPGKIKHSSLNSKIKRIIYSLTILILWIPLPCHTSHLIVIHISFLYVLNFPKNKDSEWFCSVLWHQWPAECPVEVRVPIKYGE